jgi:N-6 DNA methylase
VVTNVPKDWRKEFGLDNRKPPQFFSGKDDLTSSVPQAHILRRAFDLLELDGILCTENSPLVYFKQVGNIMTETVLGLQRQFWNHGGAPILVLISKDRVHIYSGLSRPVAKEDIQDNPPSLVETVDLVAEGLKEFLTSVESGEFFRKHAKSFDPEQRVDRDLLKNLKDTRDVLDEITQRNIVPHILDALLCRLVFTCYLFDRDVINESYLQKAGIRNASHLRNVLEIQPVRESKKALYELFQKLGNDFNGDLFSDDLEAEERHITNKHIQVLNDFFQGISVRSRQRSFWPYDFSAIPIETISAIYEHFLKVSDQQKKGVFYTPRFLAEVVLDTALEGMGSLLGKTFLDPACGSGIFLVGLFNRIAEEWKQVNPTARNDRRARELMQLLQSSLYGVDDNPTACRITAFSLYLAYLDQLTPRDIKELQAKGRALPHLIASSSQNASWNIKCVDFFAKGQDIPANYSLVIGNPPWGSTATEKTHAGQWCAEKQKPLPDKQIAAAFVWKAAEHVSKEGHICFVLPHGTLFNHNTTAIAYQKAWLCQHTLQRVLNLADFRWFLFNKAVHPALVVRYKNEKPPDAYHQIEYWAPKADWTVTRAEVITILPADRMDISVGDLLKDLNGPDAPQTWKQQFWATPRDIRLIDRLSLYPRLRDHIRGSRRGAGKSWVIAEGFQPVGKGDDPEKARKLTLPSASFIPAKSRALDLFLLPADCKVLKSETISVREKSNKNTEVFQAPHVLITIGFQRIAFADFDVSFQHALRGIHGSKEDRNLLIFLTAYLRTPLAKYFMFHTSSSWGMYRPKGHGEEVLRLPFPFPEQQPDKKRSHEIVRKVAQIFDEALKKAEDSFMDRNEAVRSATAKIEPLINEYYGVQPLEKILIDDTLNVVIPSIQPSLESMPVPTVVYSSKTQQDAYMRRLCETLNMWTKEGQYVVRGKAFSSENLGIGIAVLEKLYKSEVDTPMKETGNDVLQSLDRIRKLLSQNQNAINPVHGLMFFDKNLLYIVKPLGQRNWTQTAALNDAEEIAGTLLMHAYRKQA